MIKFGIEIKCKKKDKGTWKGKERKKNRERKRN